MGKDTQNAGKYFIKNESDEKMEGTFALYYDDSSENRKAVPGASWTLTINPNSASSPVTFTEPTSPAPKEKGKYILVFNGKLGMEENATVGRQVQFEEDSKELILYASGSEYKTYNPRTKEVKAYDGIFKGATGKVIWRQDGKAAIAVFSRNWYVVDVEKGKKRAMLSSSYTNGWASGGWRGDKAIMLGLDNYSSKIDYWEGTVDSSSGAYSYKFPEGIMPLGSVGTSRDGKEISFNGTGGNYYNDEYYVVTFDTISRTFKTQVVGENYRSRGDDIIDFCEGYSGAFAWSSQTYSETKFPVLISNSGNNAGALYRERSESYSASGSVWDDKHKCYELETFNNSISYSYDILGGISSRGQGNIGWSWSTGNYYIRKMSSSYNNFNPLEYVIMYNAEGIVTYTKESSTYTDDYFSSPTQQYGSEITSCVYFGRHLCSDKSISLTQIRIGSTHNGSLVNLNNELNMGIGYVKRAVSYGNPTVSLTSKIVFYISNGSIRDISNDHADFKDAEFFAFIKE